MADDEKQRRFYADVSAYAGSDDWRWFFAVIDMTDQHVPLPELRKRFERLPENWKMVIVVGNGERRKRKNAKPVDPDKP